MNWYQLVDSATPKDWVIIFVFVFFWPLLFALLNFLIFRTHPFGNPIRDWNELKQFFWEVANTEPEVKDKKKKRVESPDDYWDGEVNYATGEVNTNTGPSVRHPKNRDRAYSGSVERFHDGGGQDA